MTDNSDVEETPEEEIVRLKKAGLHLAKFRFAYYCLRDCIKNDTKMLFADKNVDSIEKAFKKIDEATNSDDPKEIMRLSLDFQMRIGL